MCKRFSLDLILASWDNHSDRNPLIKTQTLFDIEKTANLAKLAFRFCDPRYFQNIFLIRIFAKNMKHFSCVLVIFTKKPKKIYFVNPDSI